MKIYRFDVQGTSGEITYELLQAIRKCKVENYDKLVFEKGFYEIDRTFCEQRNLNISNHGLNGPKRIAVLLEDMQNFEVDFNGSVLKTCGNIIPIAIKNCKNVTVKNVILENPETQFMQARVVKSENGVVEFDVESGGEQFFTTKGKLYTRVGEEYLVPQTTSIEFNGKTGEIEYGTGDFPIGFPWEVENELSKDGKTFIVRDAKRLPPVGNVFIHTASRRLGCGIFCEKSAELRFENVTVHSCLGMGLLAQLCHNVTLDGFSTRRHDGQMYTANADATHFVHCTGLIKVENGVFEGQLDDALNIHGMFVRVIGKSGENGLLVKQMHFQSTGIDIFQKGDKVQAVGVKTLLPYADLTVESVDYLNDDVSLITFVEKVDGVKVGDDLENVTKCADLIFVNNVVRDNRARGMLIATKGKVLIENNYFHTSGCAILAESDGAYWFESGGTKDVCIRGNTFDTCKHGKWGSAVLQFNKREETEKDRYYHGKVEVTGNTFTMHNDVAALFDNIETLTFTGNTVKNVSENAVENGAPAVIVGHCGKKDLQDGFSYRETL